MTAPVNPRDTEGRAATHAQAQATAAASGQPLREPLTVTALFDDRAAVNRTVDALYSTGTPRDLVEVVVSRAAAERAHDATWRRSVAERTGAAPTIRYFDPFLVVDNEQGSVTQLP